MGDLVPYDGSYLHYYPHIYPLHRLLDYNSSILSVVRFRLEHSQEGWKKITVDPELGHMEILPGLLSDPSLIPSDKESVSYVLRKKEGGNIVILSVGGAKEALHAHPGAYTLVLENRKGFVRLAIENGTLLVPVFSFGENELYDQVENPKGSWVRWAQDRLQKIMGFSLPLFYARGIFQYTFGFVPYRKPIFIVVGKPIQVEKKHNPSQDEVDELHKRYLEALCMLFEEHKLKYNVPEDTHLSFI